MQHERNIMHRQKSNDEHVLVITFLCLLGGIEFAVALSSLIYNPSSLIVDNINYQQPTRHHLKLLHCPRRAVGLPTEGGEGFA
jgi:hypothetical protein